MAWIVSLIYFILGSVTFTKKIRLFAIASSVLLFLALTSISDSLVLKSIYIAIIAIAFISMFVIKASPDKKGVFYFSIPCWLLISSVLINVFLTP